MAIESSLIFDQKTKQFGIMQDFDVYSPYFMTLDPPNQQIAALAAAGVISSSFPLSYRFEGPFRGHYLCYESTHNLILVDLVDGRDGYQYVTGGRRVAIDTIMSNDPGYPAILCEALTLQQNTHINASFQNVSTNTASTMRMAVQGFAFAPGKIRTQTRKEQLESALERQHYLRPHFMTADLGAAVVANNTTLPFLFSLDDSGFFEVFKMAVRVYSSLIGAGTLANAAQLATTTLRFKDNDGKQWSPGIAADLPLTWFSTPGLRPNILPVRFMMPPSTQLTIEIANASGVALTYYITLIGRRIFAPSSAAWK